MISGWSCTHLGEKNGAVEPALVGHEIEGDVGAGGLGPGDLVDPLGEEVNVGLLVLDPAALHHPAVNAVVHRVVVLAVPLVLPPVVVGVDEVGADEVVQGPEGQAGIGQEVLLGWCKPVFQQFSVVGSSL